MPRAFAAISFTPSVKAAQTREGLDRHQRLIDSYRKLHMARSKVAAVAS